MNNRIQELAEQATTYHNGGLGTEIESFDKEKFAELIVRECVEQVITGRNGPAHYAVEAALRLKKHFGVEE